MTKVGRGQWRLNWVIVGFVVFMQLSLPATAEGRREGRGQPGRSGCGSTLVMVAVDGTRRQFTPASEFFAEYKAGSINPGETPRQALKISELLLANSASWIEARDCDDGIQHLPVGLGVEGDEYLMLTGRGTVRIVRESRAGRFEKVLKNIQTLTFHGLQGDAPTNRTVPKK